MVESKQVKTCYYELLEIERNAELKDIERAYKKGALKWHPDKNKDKDTTEIFQNILEAYNVLSDPNERAWYDDHRDQILRGKDIDESKEEDTSYLTKSKLWPYFQHCYEGFNAQNPKNFYKVYTDLFNKLDKEEEMEEMVGVEHYQAPRFGDDDSTAKEVFAFYDHWAHFQTLKQFAYADVYNPNQAPNRRVKRIIENENKKERGLERQKFNDEVVHLVEFVKKRDPRYNKFKMLEQKQREMKRQKEEEEKRKKKEEEAEKLRQYREELAKKYKEEEEEALANGDYEEVLVEEFRCEVCKKIFKKEKQMQNHLQSKKHKDNYKNYRDLVGLDPDTEQKIKEEQQKKKQELEQEQVHEEMDEEKKRILEEEQERIIKKQKKKKHEENQDEEQKLENQDTEQSQQQQQQQETVEEQKIPEQEQEKKEEYVSSKKRKEMLKQQQRKKGAQSKKEEESDLTSQSSVGKTKQTGTKISKKALKKNNKFANLNSDSDEENNNEEEEKKLQSKKQQPSKKQPAKQITKKKCQEEEKLIETKNEQSVAQEPVMQQEPKTSENQSQDEEQKWPIIQEPQQTIVEQEDNKQQSDQESDEEGSKLSKKDKRRQKKAQKNEKQEKQKKEETQCQVCRSKFETRNQLFNHIKATGHAKAIIK